MAFLRASVLRSSGRLLSARSAFTPSIVRLAFARTYATEGPLPHHKTIPPKGVTTRFQWEEELVNFLDSLPGATKFYTNADGSIRVPSDEELKNMVKLRSMLREGLSTSEYFKLSAEERKSFIANYELAKSKVAGDFDLGSEKIVDKVPVKDAKTGELEWEVVRERKKEGWEPYIYYGYIPLLGLLTLYFMFGQKNMMKNWALEELRLQTEEKYLKDEAYFNQLTPDQQLAKQLMVVDRILAGNYDELVSH
ncbi:hypothetical protein V1511DRAFT_500861 [Dipodascopsis uninucleata]